MWKAFLRDNYGSREEWQSFSDTYGLAERLGYDSADAAWEDNPYIQGSTNPADFGPADLVAYYGKRMRRWSPDKLDREDAFSIDVSFEAAKAWRDAIDKEKARRGLTT